MSSIHYKADSETVHYVTLALVSELMVEVLTLQQQVRMMEAKLTIPKGTHENTVSDYIDNQQESIKSIGLYMVDKVNSRIEELTADIKQQLAKQ